MEPNIEGLEIIKNIYHDDNRGFFTELFNKNKKDLSNLRQISLSSSRKSVLRGIHCSPYNKIVCCLKGKIFDVVVDFREKSKTYRNIFTKILNGEESLFIPAGCGHGFYCYEDDSLIQYIQSGCYEKFLEFEVNCLCPILSIPWPKDEYILSEKDQNNPCFRERNTNIDFMIFGAKGMIGTHVVSSLELCKRTYYLSQVRLEAYQDILDELERIQPKFVVCCAGIAGKPNIDWCDTNQQETIMTNVVGQLNVARGCSIKGVHCTLFGTGVLYDSAGKKFSEIDEPNFSGNFYVKQRIILEQLLNSFSVLNLRILYPITKTMHPKSIIPKLLKYKNITNAKTSFTVMDDLFPLIPSMCDQGLTGTFNFANPGTMSNKEILELYKKYVDKNHEWIETSQSGNRSHPELNVNKLLNYFPNIPEITESVENIIKSYADHERRQSLQYREKKPY